MPRASRTWNAAHAAVYQEIWTIPLTPEVRPQPFGRRGHQKLGGGEEKMLRGFSLFMCLVLAANSVGCVAEAPPDSEPPAALDGAHASEPTGEASQPLVPFAAALLLVAAGAFGSGLAAALLGGGWQTYRRGDADPFWTPGRAAPPCGGQPIPAR